MVSLQAQYSYNKFINAIDASNDISIQFTCVVSNSKVYKGGAAINGKIYIKKSSYRVELPDLLMLNNTSQYVSYNKSVNEATIFNANEEELNPNTILDLCKKSKSTKLSEKGNTVTFKLIPLIKNNFEEIVISINKTDNSVKSLTVTGVGKEIYKFNIRDYSVNQKLSDKLFSFEKSRYPNVSIIDMR